MGCEIQDSSDDIARNYALLVEAIGCANRKLVYVYQVHAAGVLIAEAGQPFNCSSKGDAIVSQDRERVLSVRVADCVPILLATADGTTVAAVHAGWRGVIADVVPAALTVMHRIHSSRGAQILAAVGPCLGEEAFEVGPEVLEPFEKAFGEAAPIRRRSDGKGWVNLREAVRMQLLAGGVSPNSIDISDCCTYRDTDEFFSHRRERGITGRMAAVISPAM